MTCWRYMQIHQQFGRGNDDEGDDAVHDVGEVISADSLPTSTRTLVRLAEAAKRDRETVVEAVKRDIVTPSMTPEDADDLVEAAKEA
jgi:hypothetical protein